MTEDRLKLEKGNRQRRYGELITPEPIVVTDRLEALIQKTTQECFQSIQQSSNDTPEFYEQIADFKREVKHLCNGLKDLQFTFRSFDCNNKNSANRYSHVCELASDFLKQVRKYKSELAKPPLNERPVKHIDCDERTKLIPFPENNTIF